MGISNSCPYCGGEMCEGAIPAGRDSIRWYPRNADGILENEWGSDEGVLLSYAGLIFGKNGSAFYCKNCGVVIAPVLEIETIGDKFEKVGQKIDDFFNRQEKEREARERRREVEGEKRRREERREKDPWER